MENTQKDKTPQEVEGVMRLPHENPMPVLRFSADANVLYRNPAVDKLLKELGINEKEILRVLPPGLAGMIEKVLKTNNPISGLEVGVLGRVYSYSIVPSNEEKCVNLYGIDVTERNAAEQKLKATVEEWDRIFNAITDLVFIQDKDYVITKANKAFLERVNLKEQAVIGKKCFEVMHKLSHPWPGCVFEVSKKSGRAHMQEVNDPNLGLPLLISISPIFNDKGEFIGALHIAKDITEIKKTEKELKAKIKDLEIFHKAAVDRELKMVELKKHIADLEKRFNL